MSFSNTLMTSSFYCKPRTLLREEMQKRHQHRETFSLRRSVACLLSPRTIVGKATTIIDGCLTEDVPSKSAAFSPRRTEETGADWTCCLRILKAHAWDSSAVISDSLPIHVPSSLAFTPKMFDLKNGKPFVKENHYFLVHFIMLNFLIFGRTSILKDGTNTVKPVRYGTYNLQCREIK